MTRVAVLAFCLLAGAGVALADRAVVLVHGAWVGEWYWDPVVAGLGEAGVPAVAVTLRGHGARSSENGPEITLADHVADVVAAIDATNADGIVLVAHSYGGRPATGAWDLRRDRIASVIYLEAPAPTGDGPVAIPADARSLAYVAVNWPAILDAGRMPVPPALAAASGGRTRPMSLAALYGEVRLTGGPLPADTPRLYVTGSASEAIGFHALARHLEGDPLWRVREIASGHDMVRDAAPALVGLILSAD